jgi:hypothetical protein
LEGVLLGPRVDVVVGIALVEIVHDDAGQIRDRLDQAPVGGRAPTVRMGVKHDSRRVHRRSWHGAETDAGRGRFPVGCCHRASIRRRIIGENDPEFNLAIVA